MDSKRLFKNGEIIYHIGRGFCYRIVYESVRIKLDDIWVEGAAYKCLESGKVYIRPLDLFGNFLILPKYNHFWYKLRNFFSSQTIS